MVKIWKYLCGSRDVDNNLYFFCVSFYGYMITCHCSILYKRFRVFVKPSVKNNFFWRGWRKGGRGVGRKSQFAHIFYISFSFSLGINTRRCLTQLACTVHKNCSYQLLDSYSQTCFYWWLPMVLYWQLAVFIKRINRILEWRCRETKTC